MIGISYFLRTSRHTSIPSRPGNIMSSNTIFGADDYVTKPFSTRELIARVKANLRRHYSQPAQEVNDTSNEIVIKDIGVNSISSPRFLIE